MLKLLMPQLSTQDLKRISVCALFGSLCAGIYGAVHDQITFSLAPEYFTKFKFDQITCFRTNHDRLDVAIIGFVATWWVGLLLSWFLARRHFPGHSLDSSYKRVLSCMAIVAISAVISGLVAFVYTAHQYPGNQGLGWEIYERCLDINDLESFVQVAYIHNAGYLGAILGFLIAFVGVTPAAKSQSTR